MADKAGVSNVGVVVAVRGSVVDVRFDKNLPSIYTLLRMGVKNPDILT
jgi:F-type H+-transporting ATPase subunit beta